MEKIMEKLFYKGRAISSEDAHALALEEKVHLTSRKPSLEEVKKKKGEEKNAK